MTQLSFFVRSIVIVVLILVGMSNVFANGHVKGLGNNEEVFRSKYIAKQFSLLSIDEQVDFLEKLLDKHYTNQPEFAQFLSSAVHQLQFKKLNNAIAFNRLQYKLFSSTFEVASFELAERIYHTKEQFRRIRYHKVLPHALVTLGYKFSQTNQLDSLELVIQQLGKLWSSKLPKWIKLEYFAKKAYLSAKKGDFYEALIFYNKALAYTSQSDSQNKSYIYHNLANLYLSMENFHRANHYAELSVLTVGFENYPKEQLNLIGTVQSKAGKYQQAEKTFQKVLRFAQLNDLKLLQAQSLSNYGNLKRKKKDFQSALQFMYQSDSICKLLGMDIGIIINAINRAELFLDLNNLRAADTQLAQIEKRVSLIADPRQLYEFYKLYAKIKDAAKQPNFANVYFRKAAENKEKFWGDSPQSIIAQWELEREREQFEDRRIADQIKLLHQQQAKNNIIFSLVVTLLAGAFIFSYFLRKQALKNSKLFIQQQQIHHELELKSKELFAETLKNQSVANLKNDIKQNLEQILKKKMLFDQDLKDYIMTLGKSDSSVILDEFEARFNGVHAHFYDKLKQIAPDLTPHELRLSALIRLNISSKEIAALTNRTVGTIDNSRSIIRKKLGLDESQNLQDFILKL